MKSVCYQCEARTSECHATCEKYEAERNKSIEKYKAYAKGASEEAAYRLYLRDATKRMKTRRKK